MTTKYWAALLAIFSGLGCSSGDATPPSTVGDAARDTSEPPTLDGGDQDAANPADSSAPGDATTPKDGSIVVSDAPLTSCPATKDEIPGDRQSCEFPKFCWEFRNHDFTKLGDCQNCRNLSADGKPAAYHLGGCWRTDTVGGCSEMTSGGPTVTFFYPESSCSEASVCTSQDVQNNCKAPRTYVPPGN